MRTNNFSRSILIVCGITLASVVFTDTAIAQIKLEEIIVTARKREQSIQDVPISISAFDAGEIRAAGFDNIVDISRVAPGLFIETINSVPARVDTSPRFRGVTYESASPLRRTASIFVDGIIVTGALQSIAVQELERVEIIKGPQSALFGRNTFSGAINYITKSPSDKLSADISVDVATRDEYKVMASVEGPLTDTLGARVFLNYSDKQGHHDNESVPGQKLGDEESFTIGGVFEFTPSERIKVRFRGNVYEDNDGPAAVIRVAGFSDHNFGGFPVASGGKTETAFKGTVPIPGGADVGLNTSQAFFYRIAAQALNDKKRRVNFIDLDFGDLGGFGLVREGFRFATSVSFDITESLNLSVLGGINEDEYLQFGDFDGDGATAFVPAGTGFVRPVGEVSPLGFNTRNGRETKEKSIEARLAGNFFEQRLGWSVGVSYVDIKTETIGGFHDNIRDVYFDGIFNERFLDTAETIGLFGSLDFKLTDKITVIFEGRYQEDDIVESSILGTGQPDDPIVESKLGDKFSTFLPRAVVQFEPTVDSLFYASYSVGNFPGGFNTEITELTAAQLVEFNSLVPGVGLSFEEESLNSYELGWKQTLFDGRASFNIAGFYMERKDQIFSGFQVVAAPGTEARVRTVAFTDNGATTEIFGAELEGTLRATENLTLSGTAAYTDAQIESFPAGGNAGDFTAVYGANANPKGQRAPRFPKWTASFSGSYERPINLLNTEADWYMRTDVFYTGKFFDENTNLAELPDATVVNLRSGIRQGSITVEGYVTNLFNEHAPVAGNNIADTSGDVRARFGFGRFVTGLFDFTRESVHVALRDVRQVGLRVLWNY